MVRRNTPTPELAVDQPSRRLLLRRRLNQHAEIAAELICDPDASEDEQQRAWIILGRLERDIRACAMLH